MSFLLPLNQVAARIVPDSDCEAYRIGGEVEVMFGYAPSGVRYEIYMNDESEQVIKSSNAFPDERAALQAVYQRFEVAL